jgi:RNA 2',3'-cyclic 3'-phosphodiesterase
MAIKATADFERELIMTAFIGIDFDKELKNEIVELQNKLRKNVSKGRWTFEDNFHVTLKFFEEINETEREEISKVMINLCGNTVPFNLAIEKLGVFKGSSVIRALWIGLGGDISSLRTLHSNIENEINEIGIEKEKKSFKPHVTIGRELVFNCPPNSINDLVDIQKLPSVDVDRLFLFKSEQIGKKRVYTKIDEYLLK